MYNRRTPLRVQTRRATSRRSAAPISTGTSFTKQGTTGFKMSQLTPTKTMIVGRSFLLPVDTSSYKLQPVSGGGAPTNGNGVLGVFDVNPTLLGDRVSQIAATFEKYVYKRLTFRYIPQCSTGTPGSVAIVFDRDPDNICANPQSTSFLAQVMSYENAALTPAWQHAEVTYYREKGEKKLYYVGGQEANLDARTTSQGNLIVYASNTNNNTSLGFIVCDYVLELSIPNILPKLNGAANISMFANSPSQYSYGLITDGNNGSANIAYKAAGAAATTLQINALGTAVCDYTLSTSTSFAPGTIGELVLAGAATDALFVGNSMYKMTGAATASACGLKPGDKIYFAVSRRISGAGTKEVINFFITLPEAASYVRTGNDNFTDTTADNVAYTFHYDGMLVGPYNGTADVRGWWRILNAGDNALSAA